MAILEPVEKGAEPGFVAQAVRPSCSSPGSGPSGSIAP
ncbi:hypothetical protein STTU_1426 [Streptomyces sp. Tu6071]|nr:hypothetical protein STTU_1426 [Streptomyces sp. Tu6071]